jgi:hypothetical protein
MSPTHSKKILFLSNVFFLDSQIWLRLLVEDCQPNYLTKLGKKKEKKKGDYEATSQIFLK